MKANYTKEISDYIEQVNSEYQPRLTLLRELVHELVPEVTEKFSWGMATFSYFGNLVHIGVGKGYIGLYPAPSAVTHFQSKLVSYKTSKGSIHLPMKQELPMELLREIILFRKEENEESAKNK